MDSKQNSKLNMAQRVSDTMELHTDDYAGMEPMVSAVEELKTDIANIRKTEKDQVSVSVSASSQQKHESEIQMVESCVPVANALNLIGFATGNKVLTNLAGTTPSIFYREEDNAKVARSKNILDLAKKNVSELAKYGFTEEKIAGIETKIDSFKNLIAKPMETIGLRKQKTTNLKQHFASLNSTLKNKLDKLIMLFKSSHPDFYDEYRTARNIIGMSARRKKETEVVSQE
jgi:hypothetical protein